MEETYTDPKLNKCILAEYTHDSGVMLMLELVWSAGRGKREFMHMVRDQEWRRFLEGMICTMIREIR
jgi:hypothetical protein